MARGGADNENLLERPPHTLRLLHVVAFIHHHLAGFVPLPVVAETSLKNSPSFHFSGLPLIQ